MRYAGVADGYHAKHTNIAQSQSLAISALTEPIRQKSRRKKRFRSQNSQPEIANRRRLSIAIIV